MRGGKTIGVILGTLMLGAIALGLAGYLLRSRVLSAVAATSQVQADLTRRDLRAGCADLASAAAAWESAATLSQPLAPILRRLGWLPTLGADLRVAPDAILLARHGTAAGSTACRVLEPALLATTTPERLAAAGRQLSQHTAALATIQSDLEAAQHAWQAIAPHVAESPRLAPYQAQLETFGRLAPTATQALSSAQQSAPQLPWLLGLESSRRYLVVLQNPFELRPTGGFIGLVCVVQVTEAKPALERCQPSEAYTATANAATPFPYTRYLRLGGWYLRDANWSPDFPTTARTLQEFWAANGQPPVDGVIAVDPYALEPLLQASGPLTLGDGSTIGADQIVAAILSRYYDGSIYRDKGQLAELLPALFQHLLTTDLATLPQVAAALHTGIAEGHVLVALNQPDLAAALKAQRWDGSLAPATHNTLRIVDADVGYGAVNAFIDRLTDYQVALADDGTPLTATLTLTYTNRYSAWAEAPTAYAVNGQCTDPATLQLERRPGCYANYLRVYVPQNSQLLDAEGLEESLGVDQQHGRTIFGGYLRVQPGAERVVRLSYRLPALTPGALTIEKQPGTIASPIKITAATPTHQTTISFSARTDLTLAIQTSGANVTIDGQQDQAVAEAFARHAAWIDGLTHWQAGDHQAALLRWQAGAALDRAIDYALTLPAAEAIALTEAIATVESSGRAAFEQATLTEAQGRQAAADALYRTAAERSPENPLAQLTWTRRQIQTGVANPDMRQVAQTSSAVRRWRAAADALEQTERLDEAAAYLDVLLRVTPDDRALALRHTDLLLRTDQQGLALGRYEVLAQQDDIWGRLAGARRAQINGDRQGAIALYSEALPLATDYSTAFRIGDGLRDLGAQPEAVQAYDRAASLAPGSIWPLLAAGDMLRGTDTVAARTWYSRAQQIDPASGYPDFALGTMLLNHGDTTGAIQSFVAATTKQPDVQLFQETLDRVQA
ncbi:MAG: DUF4012 domain-containing protein, partial [Chloroflexi bacterium]|nr:DUF4012 domain-containing protein [Chloroflexota bacterium]